MTLAIFQVLNNHGWLVGLPGASSLGDPICNLLYVLVNLVLSLDNHVKGWSSPSLPIIAHLLQWPPVTSIKSILTSSFPQLLAVPAPEDGGCHGPKEVISL